MWSDLKFGVNVYKFPQFRGSLAELTEFVCTADALGYHHVRFLDHIVGIVAERHGGIAQTPYTAQSEIHECFTLMAYLAPLTKNIRLVTGVLALPMRQTVLVAKQASELDHLTGGRITLGIGVGYNAVEFEAVGAEFSNRGQRFEEQIDVLRKLWTEEVVSYSGRWHTIRDASLSPLPIQRPIPLWIGVGRSINPIPPDSVLRRVGRLADGWMPMISPDATGQRALDVVRAAAEAAGRDPKDVKLEMNLAPEGKSRDAVLRELEAMRAFGATQIMVGFSATSPREQIDALKRFHALLQSAS